MTTVDSGVQARSMRASVVLSAVFATTLFAFVIFATWTSADQLSALNVAAVASGDVDTSVLLDDPSFAGIAMRNLGAALLLAAGIPMLGIPTVFALPVIGMTVGYSGASVVATLGVAITLDRVGPYIAFEFAGVLLAATAGVLPVVHATRGLANRSRPAGFGSSYTDALLPALLLVVLAAVLIVLGAAIESVVIATLV